MSESTPPSEQLEPRLVDHLRGLAPRLFSRIGRRSIDGESLQLRPIAEILGEIEGHQTEIGSVEAYELIAAINHAPLHFSEDTYDKTYIPDDRIAEEIELVQGSHSTPNDVPTPRELWSVRLNPMMFTAAPGLDAWQPRKRMKPYDERADPIVGVTIDVYPDGSVAASCSRDGAHRLLAARWANVKRREGATVAARNVTVRRIADTVGQVL